MEKEIVDLYLAGFSGLKIAKKLQIHQCVVYRILTKHKILRTNKENYKIIFNDSVFEKIDSNEKAYWLGLLMADGQVQNKKQSSKILRIDLENTDAYIIYKFADFLNLDHKRIKSYINNNDTKFSRLVVPSDKICQDLEKFGIIPNKTFTCLWPYLLEEKYFSHFIRGYFDGDGCITNIKKGGTFKIIGTEEFLSKMQEALIKLLDFNKTKLQERHPERKTNIRSLEYGGSNQMIRLREFLYKDAILYLKRKYDKFYSIQNRRTSGKNKQKERSS